MELWGPSHARKHTRRLLAPGRRGPGGSHPLRRIPGWRLVQRWPRWELAPDLWPNRAMPMGPPAARNLPMRRKATPAPPVSSTTRPRSRLFLPYGAAVIGSGLSSTHAAPHAIPGAALALLSNARRLKVKAGLWCPPPDDCQAAVLKRGPEPGLRPPPRATGSPRRSWPWC